MGRSLGLLSALLVIVVSGCLSPPSGDGEGPMPLPPVSPVCASPCPIVVHDGSEASWEPSVAINPLDPDHIVAASSLITSPELPGDEWWWAYAHVSRDGGSTWKTVRLPGGRTAPADHPLAGASLLADSVVDFLPDGTVIYSLVAGRLDSAGVVATQTAGDVVVLRSHDGGITYPSEEIQVIASGVGTFVAAGAGPAFVGDAVEVRHHKQWHTVGPRGDILIAWTQEHWRDPNRPSLDVNCQLAVRYSPDGGVTWNPVRLADPGGCPVWAFPAFLENETWGVAYFDDFSHPSRLQGDLFVTVSRDQGDTWITQRIAGPAASPTLAAVPMPGGATRWLLTYADAVDPDRGVQAPVFVWTDDGGLTWGDPVRLDEPASPGRVFPALAVGTSGTAWATYYVPRGNDSDRSASFRAVVIEAGRASEPTVLDDQFLGTTNQVGDYVGLDVHGDWAFSVWVSHGEESFEVYDLTAARLVLGDPSH